MEFYCNIQNYDELRFTVSTNIMWELGFTVTFKSMMDCVLLYYVEMSFTVSTNIMWEWGFTVTFNIMMDYVLYYYPI